MTLITMMNLVCLKFLQAMFIMLLILQVDLVCAEQVRCLETERQALLHFKASLVDDDDRMCLSSWGVEEDKRDCCKWKGVRCSNLTSHIELLDTGDCYLRGEIHNSLTELQHLKYLNLSHNDFDEDTPIPDFFGSLSNLRYLDLSAGYFGGKFSNQFGSLSHLKYLSLKGNFLVGSVPYQLGNLSKLQYLDLSRNYLEGTLPSSLGNLLTLKKLYLGNNFSGALKIDDGNHTRGQWLSNLTSLTHLDLSWISNLNDSHSLLQVIVKVPKLIELRLSDCSLSDDFLLSLSPSKFKFSSSLAVLDLSWNTFSSSMIFHWVSNLASLTYLDLNGISGLNNSHSWLQMIAELPKLTELRLSDCSLSDNFLLSLGPSKFKFPSSLVVLDLSRNTFISSMIFQWVSNVSSNLVELDLSYNLLEGPISNDFGTAMTSLGRLYLSFNRIKGGVMKSLMNICTLHSLIIQRNNLIEDLYTIVHHLSSGCVRYSLQELVLSYNQITGRLPDLSIFPSLKMLDLSTNRLSGKTPENSRLPSQLVSLFVDSNSLEGGIPKVFGNSCSLRSLSFSYNNLSEELPVITHHLSGCARLSLQELNLDVNQINGTLPNLSIFPSLKRLCLARNSLKGVITDFHFANVSKLKSLHLSDNSLTMAVSQNWTPSFQLEYLGLRSCKLGPAFPKWLQTQSNYKQLDVSNSGISDIVPTWFWALSRKLDVMHMSYNNLTGTIPNFSLTFIGHPSISLAGNQFEGPIPPFLRSAESLDLSENKISNFYLFLCSTSNDTFAKLGRLYLSNNRLSGQIPNCWNNFKSLVYVDLSNNNLFGQIPTTLGSAIKLQALLLRNNSLTGELPFTLRSCTQLVMLDAGENKLSGLIPPWIGSSLQQLQMLSLRRNHFFGSLPLSLCYLTSIQLLDLSSNNLKGRIPKCFKNFSAMTQKNFSRDACSHYYVVNATYGDIEYCFDLIALLMWKGVEHTIYNDNLLLKSIDLSSNQLSEEIPLELGNLIEMVSLNLSRNNLLGSIPSEIGRLKSLEFLDLSRNDLFGSIPFSLSKIDRLTMLDLSHNYLSGEIPTSTQLQSFNASSYEDNSDLCGRPLEKMCKDKDTLQEPIVKFPEDEDLLFAHAFYMSMGYGFATGFWGIFGSILVKRSWRDAYFRFLNNIMNNIYVMIAMKIAKYQTRPFAC